MDTPALPPGTLPTIPEADVFTRLKKVIGYVSSRIPAGSKGSSIAKRIADEMLNDMTEIPPEFVEFYLKQLAAMIHWTATGQSVDDMPLPEDFDVAE